MSLNQGGPCRMLVGFNTSMRLASRLRYQRDNRQVIILKEVDQNENVLKRKKEVVVTLKALPNTLPP